MGCCFSTPNECPKEQNHPHHQDASNIHKSNPTSPEQKSNATHEIENHKSTPPGPPPPLVEETVKEVLSETPISKPQVSILNEETSTHMAEIEPQVANFEKVDEVSEVTEICSVNDSISTTTTTTTTPIAVKREEEVTSKKLNQPPLSNVSRKRSCNIDSSDGRERRQKSPARRSEPSPEKKRNQVNMRSVRGRESGMVATRKPNVGPSRVRRDCGEASCRRSKSPATRAVKPTEEAVENGGSEKAEVLPESLDNPLVSLECFIFL